MIHDVEDSVVLVVDVQAPLVAVVAHGQDVVKRGTFLVDCARALGVPVLATVQYEKKLGSLDPGFNLEAFDKRSFSAWLSPQLVGAVEGTRRKSLVLCGLETHICVLQTALDALAAGYRVSVVVDACSSRTTDRHLNGLARLASSGATVAHSESVVYEWLRSADHPKFGEVLKLVKGAPA